MADRPHYYASLPGWFDYADLFDGLVAQLGDGAHVVEVGGWKGKSAAYMGVLLANSGKTIRYDVVDTWLGSAEHVDDPDVQHGRLYDVFLANTATVREYVRPVRSTSVEAAASYPDASLDAVFLDGDHSTAAVVADCQAWWPKVKPGGVLMGHDRDWVTVAHGVKAFEQFVGVKLHPVSQRSWMLQKPIPVEDWAVPEEERALLIAVCCNERGIYPAAVKSLWKNTFGAKVTNALRQHGWQDAEPAWVDQYPSVAAQRDYAMLAAIKMNASHVLFLDSDNTWTNDGTLLEKMLRHHSAGIVAGVYHLKKWPYWPVVLRDPYIDPDDYEVNYKYVKDEIKGTDLFPADLVGMGCTLVPVRAALAIGNRPWFEYKQNRIGLDGITEDVAFCARARAIGAPILVDPTIKCGHIAQQEITEPWFDRGMVEVDLVNRAREEAAEAGEETPTGAADQDEIARARARGALALEEARIAAQEKRRAEKAKGSAA